MSTHSHRLKLRRADEHLADLRDRIAQWNETGPLSIEKIASPDFTRFSVQLKVNKAPDLVSWSLVAADCAHNLRSALDHLVYGCAVKAASQDPPPHARDLAYPLSADATAFANAKPKVLRGLSNSVKDCIATFQPYNRPHPIAPPMLAVLNAYDNTDKHRLVQLASANQTEGGFRDMLYEAKIGFGELTVSWSHAALVDGAEIAAVTFPSPVPDLTYRFESNVVIAMPHVVGPNGLAWSEAPALLSLIRDEVEEILDAVEAAAGL